MSFRFWNKRQRVAERQGAEFAERELGEPRGGGIGPQPRAVAGGARDLVRRGDRAGADRRTTDARRLVDGGEEALVLELARSRSGSRVSPSWLACDGSHVSESRLRPCRAGSTRWCAGSSSSNGVSSESRRAAPAPRRTAANGDPASSAGHAATRSVAERQRGVTDQQVLRSPRAGRPAPRTSDTSRAGC